MSINEAVAIINASMWFGCSIAISVAIYCTHDARCLFFFLIPAFVGAGYTTKTNTDK